MSLSEPAFDAFEGTLVMPSGVRLMCNRGIVGLNFEDGTWNFYDGYDGTLDPRWSKYDSRKEMTKEDRIALCKWMAKRWLEAAEQETTNDV